ncbi:MAG: DUF2156 domain-containing protein [Christensenellales bacterium]
MKFKPIELKDKQLFDSVVRPAEHECSESSFANLYIWRHFWKIQMCDDGDALYFLLKFRRRDLAFAPVPRPGGSLCEAVCKLEKYVRQRGMNVTLHCCEDQRRQLEKECPGRFDFSENRANFEYIYEGEALRTLAGRKFHSKRNHIANFTSFYDYEYVRLTNDDAAECLALYDRWIRERDPERLNTIDTERLSVEDAFKNMDELGLIAAGIRVNSCIEAFTMGERKRKDMALIHIEKANPNMRGLYPLINYEFLNNEFPDVEFVNREEDMGIDGLRKAKMSYYPVRFVKKYRTKL